VDPDQKLERRLGLRGVIVMHVPEGSPAHRAGLRGLTKTPRGILLGDVIVGVGEDRVNDYDELYTALDAKNADEVVKVTIVRGKECLTVDVRLVVVTHPSLI